MQGTESKALRIRGSLALLILLSGFVSLFAQDGQLDNSFGTNGLITTNIPEGYEVCGDAISDYSGKIIIAGSALSGGNNKAMLMRLTGDGIADSTFSENGYKLYASVGGVSESNFYSVAIQQDGKILAGGYARYSDATYGVIFRIDDDGAFDITFGNNGVTKLFSGDYWNDAAISDIIVQPDGKILFCGFEDSENTGDIDQFVTGRCLPDGTLDSTFGGTGIVYCYFDGSASNATTMLLQSDGKIVVGGRTNENFALIRYLPNGEPDNTFGTWGEVTISISDDEHLTDLGILSDERIIATGYVEANNPGTCEYGKTKIAVACYNPDGSLSNAFSSDGKAIFTFDYCNDEAYSLLVQPDDKIIIGGGSGNSSMLESFNYIFLRLLPDGSRDMLFGIEGLTETEMYEENEFYSYPKALFFQPSGKAVLAGYTNDWEIGNTFFSTMRINTGVDPQDLIEQEFPEETENDNNSPAWSSDNILFIHNTLNEPLPLMVYTISGALVFTLNAPEGLTEYNLDTLSKGIYFVVSAKSGFMHPQKIIVSHAGY